MPKCVAVEASVIVLYLTGDELRQPASAVGLFRAAAAGQVQLIIPTPVLQETVYALETFYDGTPETNAPKPAYLLSLTGVDCPDARWVTSSGCQPRLFSPAENGIDLALSWLKF